MIDNIILNEIYFGKLPGLLKIEDLFVKFQQKHKRGDGIKTLSTYRDMIKDPILLKIGKEISSIFGFKEVAITLARDDSFNAYTIPFVSGPNGISYDLDERPVIYKDLRNSVIVTNNGFRFDTKKFPVNLLACINLGCLFHSPITIPELMAVLLHEIGHNFALVVMGHKMLPKSNETFADSFAGYYGYGVELTSAFSKIAIRYSDFDKRFKNVPILNIITGLSQITKGILYHDPTEAHPTTKVRLDNILRQMETDLKETPNLTPGMRADLQSQIERTKQLISKTYDPGPNANTGERMTKYYHREWEPAIESNENKKADRYSHPHRLNKQIIDIMNGSR